MAKEQGWSTILACPSCAAVGLAKKGSSCGVAKVYGSEWSPLKECLPCRRTRSTSATATAICSSRLIRFIVRVRTPNDEIRRKWSNACRASVCPPRRANIDRPHWLFPTTPRLTAETIPAIRSARRKRTLRPPPRIGRLWLARFNSCCAIQACFGVRPCCGPKCPTEYASAESRTSLGLVGPRVLLRRLA